MEMSGTSDTGGWQTCKQILCFRPDNMGDVLMTTPAFRALKEAVPGRRLTLLTSSVGAAIARAIPEIDDIIVFDVPWVQTANGAGREAVLGLVDELQQRQFDAAVLFTVQSQNPLPSAMVCYLAGIPKVLGYCRENPYHLLTDWVPDPEVLVATRHEVERQLVLVATIGCSTANQRLSLSVDPTAQQQALEALKGVGVSVANAWLVLHAGVSEAKRQYGQEEYIKAAHWLMQKMSYQIILTGSRSEWTYVEAIRQALGEGAYNLAGSLPLDAFVGLIAEAPVLISNNTGPVHIAAAVGTPVVVLYAMTNPQHTPWMVPNRVLYFEVPAHLRSRNQLLQQFPEPAEPRATPEGIVQAVEELTTPNLGGKEEFRDGTESIATL